MRLPSAGLASIHATHYILSPTFNVPIFNMPIAIGLRDPCSLSIRVRTDLAAVCPCPLGSIWVLIVLLECMGRKSHLFIFSGKKGRSYTASLVQLFDEGCVGCILCRNAFTLLDLQFVYLFSMSEMQQIASHGINKLTVYCSNKAGIFRDFWIKSKA